MVEWFYSNFSYDRLNILLDSFSVFHFVYNLLLRNNMGGERVSIRTLSIFSQIVYVEQLVLYKKAGI